MTSTDNTFGNYLDNRLSFESFLKISNIVPPFPVWGFAAFLFYVLVN